MCLFELEAEDRTVELIAQELQAVESLFVSQFVL